MVETLGNKRVKWRITFTGADTLVYNVDIFAADYDGEPIQLTPTATPVEWEEDNSDDLLECVRTRTGYVNIVEHYMGELDDIYPVEPLDRPVTVYTGEDVLFSGFIQTQSFTRGYTYPAIVELPLVCPLGVAKSVYLDEYEPQMLTVNDILKRYGQKINMPVNIVVMPHFISNNNQTLLDDELNSMSVCPYGELDVKKPDAPLYKPMTYYDFIEGLCIAWGCIVHYSWLYLTFARFDRDGDYCSRHLTVNQGITVMSPKTATISDSLAVIDDAERNSIMACSKVTIQNDGSRLGDSQTFNMSRSRLGVVSSGPNCELAALHSLDGLFTSPSLLQSNHIGSNDMLQNIGVMLAVKGVDSAMPCVLIRATGSSVSYFTVTFPQPPLRSFYLECTVEEGDNMVELSAQDANASVRATVEWGGQYLQADGSWGTSTNGVALVEKNAGGPRRVLVADPGDTKNRGKLTVTFRIGSSKTHIAVSNIRLFCQTSPIYDFSFPEGIIDRIYNGTTGGGDEKVITETFLAGTGADNSLYNVVYPWAPYRPDYKHLLRSRQRIVLTLQAAEFRKVCPLSEYTYLDKYKYMGKMWRIVSVAHSPYNSTTTIQMQEI